MKKLEYYRICNLVFSIVLDTDDMFIFCSTVS